MKRYSILGKKAGKNSRLSLNIIIILILLSITVFATIPTVPLIILPENKTTISDSYTNLTCSGSTDPDGNITNIFFKKISSITQNPYFRIAGVTVSGWYFHVNTSADYDGDTNLMLDMNPAGQRGHWGDAAGNAQGLCERGDGESYYLNTSTISWANQKIGCENLNGTSPANWHFAVIQNSDENALLSDLCSDAAYCYVGGVNNPYPTDWYWAYNQTHNLTLQNNTQEWYQNTNIAGLFNWSCQICDVTDECTSTYVSWFNVSFPRLNATFYDEDSNEYIGTSIPVSIEFITDEGTSINTTSTNGTFSFQVAPANYSIRYKSNESIERIYFVNVPSATTVNLRLYLLNKTNQYILNVTATVLSTLNNRLEGSIINSNKYDINTNSYKTMERVITNFDGTAKLHVTTDEYYKFVIEYPDGITRKITNPTYIYDSDLSFVIDIGTDATADFFNIYNLDYTLTFDNTSNLFILTYIDSASVINNICLEVYEKETFGDTQTNNSCLYTQSGTIQIGIPINNGTTYLAKAYITLKSGTSALLDSIEHFFKGENIFGKMGVLIVIFLTMIFGMSGVWSPTVALILTPIPLLFASITKIIDVSTGVAIAVFIVFIIMGAIVSKRQNG